MMATSSRPSLDVLVPLVMIDCSITNENHDSLSCESSKDILRHFESGDLVLVRSDTQCVPAIVFNISGLVMKFDIDRQLYHVCLLDNNYTERWVDATDMVIYSVPMIAECDNEQITRMWSRANELLEIRNNDTDDDKNRLEEFKRRYVEIRKQQAPLSLMNTARKEQRPRTSSQKVVSQIIYYPLTICEELHIIDSIYQLSPCTYASAQHVAEDTYMKIVCTNNRENVQSPSMGIVSEQWFPKFVVQKFEYFRRYASTWLSDLEATLEVSGHENELRSLISLMKRAI